MEKEFLQVAIFVSDKRLGDSPKSFQSIAVTNDLHFWGKAFASLETFVATTSRDSLHTTFSDCIQKVQTSVLFVSRHVIAIMISTLVFLIKTFGVLDDIISHLYTRSQTSS